MADQPTYSQGIIVEHKGSGERAVVMEDLEAVLRLSLGFTSDPVRVAKYLVRKVIPQNDQSDG